jgi:hypothetical protein
MDLLPSEVTQMKQMVVGHEVGHGLSLAHSTECGKLMFEDPLEHIPVPLDYSTGERNRFRLHLKH